MRGGGITLAIFSTCIVPKFFIHPSVCTRKSQYHPLLCSVLQGSTVCIEYCIPAVLKSCHWNMRLHKEKRRQEELKGV
jgi:hypothetical protein